MSDQITSIDASSPEELSSRQQQVLSAISQITMERGYPPSVRELGEVLGLSSPASVHAHLRQLVDTGHIRKLPGRSRAIQIVEFPQDATVTQFPSTNQNPGGVTDTEKIVSPTMVEIPLVGSIAAGTDVLAEENVEETMSLPLSLVGTGELFILEVRGDSMRDAGILSGDYVVIRRQPDAENGEMVAALIAEGEEATIKNFYRDTEQIELRPANPDYSSMFFQEGISILGKVVSVFRRL